MTRSGTGLFGALRQSARPSVFFGVLFTTLGALFVFIAPPIGIVLITAGVSTFVLFAWMAFRSLREDGSPED